MYTSWLCHSKFEFFSNVCAACGMPQEHIQITSDTTWPKVVRCCTNEKFCAINVMFCYWVIRKVFFRQWKSGKKVFPALVFLPLFSSFIFFYYYAFFFTLFFSFFHSLKPRRFINLFYCIVDIIFRTKSYRYKNLTEELTFIFLLSFKDEQI